MNSPAAWYVKTKNGSAGPFTMEQLKTTADAGKLPRNAMLSQRPDGPWMPAGDFRQIFPEEEFTAEDLRPGDLVPEPVKKMSMTVYSAIGKAASNSTELVAGAVESMRDKQKIKALKRAEEKKAIEAKIKMLESQSESIPSKPEPRSSYPSENVRVVERHHHHAPQPQNIQQIVHVNAGPQLRRRWSRGVAIILSFFIPGLGQMYKGQIFNGLLWFVLTIGGYALFIFPGLILHLLCIVGASMGDEYR